MEKFKVNLISGVDDLSAHEIIDLVERDFGLENYFCSKKEDGVRMFVSPTSILGRSNKPSKSIDVGKRFEPLKEVCKKYNCILDGEFYSNEMSFNEIYRFYSNVDVTRKSVRLAIEKTKQFIVLQQGGKLLKKKLVKGNPLPSGWVTQYFHEYGNRSVDWLCTFHDSLTFNLFDIYFIDEPDLKFEQRVSRLKDIFLEEKLYKKSCHLIDQHDLRYFGERKKAAKHYFETITSNGGEGVVLSHRDRIYKNGRHSFKSGMFIKIKDNQNEYDAVVIDVVEGTESTGRRIVDGKEVASSLKGDRIPSGRAKGFLINYKGFDFIVGLKGFDHTKMVEVLENKNSYIGRSFKYKAMLPVKNVPRHAFFECWRDET